MVDEEAEAAIPIPRAITTDDSISVKFRITSGGEKLCLLNGRDDDVVFDEEVPEFR